MHIKRIKIEGFKTFRRFDLELKPDLNIIVGDNETGKSTLLEAINLVLSCQLDGRNILYELNPYIFNSKMVAAYFDAIKEGERPQSPHILIEAYLEDDKIPQLAKLKGTNNSLGDNCPGLSLKVDLKEDCATEFFEYMQAPENPHILPTEYYTTAWRSFTGNSVGTRNPLFHSRIIDTSLNRGYLAPNKYLSKIISDYLDSENLRALAAAYRKLKNAFTKEDGIKRINKRLEQLTGDLTSKSLTVSMDMSARSTWDSSITAHLDEIPYDYVGKGEQCRVQMKLAIDAASRSNVLLIEEPENHLSHSNMTRLIEEIATNGGGRQIILTTHSSFVLNKLGIHNVKLLSQDGHTMTLAKLSSKTKDYFMKLPGYNTLRLILARRTILVEGPSDELVLQKAYKTTHGKLPLGDGVDVISVNALAFNRFLEIGELLNLDIRVVTDNDNNIAALKKKYAQYLGDEFPRIRICYDDDETCGTLEPQLLKANSVDILNKVFGTTYLNKEELLKYMTDNKTEMALVIFDSPHTLTFPGYIIDAIKQ